MAAVLVYYHRSIVTAANQLVHYLWPSRGQTVLIKAERLLHLRHLPLVHRLRCSCDVTLCRQVTTQVRFFLHALGHHKAFLLV